MTIFRALWGRGIEICNNASIVREGLEWYPIRAVSTVYTTTAFWGALFFRFSNGFMYRYEEGLLYYASVKSASGFSI